MQFFNRTLLIIYKNEFKKPGELVIAQCIAEIITRFKSRYMKIKTANTILYCSKWEETVRFYREHLNLPVIFSTDWFVEFSLGTTSRLSIADEKCASIKTCNGKGITLSLEVKNIDNARDFAEKSGLKPTMIKKHPWDARTFYLFDPEGHRIEIWQSLNKG